MASLVAQRGIFEPTEPPDADAEQGGATGTDDAPETAAEPKAARGKKKRRRLNPEGESDNGAKLYLSKDIRFRLRMYAYRENKGLSEVANELLHQVLPEWSVEAKK
jgi:hypothetical protein